MILFTHVEKELKNGPRVRATIVTYLVFQVFFLSCVDLKGFLQLSKLVLYFSQVASFLFQALQLIQKNIAEHFEGGNVSQLVKSTEIVHNVKCIPLTEKTKNKTLAWQLVVIQIEMEITTSNF